jgi:Abortive infection C-terminus
MTDLVSTRTRGRFRDLATDSRLAAIDRAFQDEGLAPNPDTTYQDSSARCTLAQEYLENVNWSDPDQVTRALRAIERVLDGCEGAFVEKFWKSPAHDGYKRDPESGLLDIPVTTFSPGSLSNLKDASVIQTHLTRIQRALAIDPELAIGSAKELIESTVKLVLDQRRVAYDKNDDIVALIDRSQEAIGLSPAKVPTTSPDGGGSIKRILGGASSVAIGVAELRNQYGTGHGSGRVRAGLRARHAHLQ